MAAGATGCTDVTGYGLLGHLAKMAAASGVDAEIEVAAVPFLAGTRELAAAGAIPGGSRRNRDWVAPQVDAGRSTSWTCCCWPTPRPPAACSSAPPPTAPPPRPPPWAAPAAVIGRVRAGVAAASALR